MHPDFCIVYSGSIVRADLLKCLLEGHGIETFLEDQYVGMMTPYISPGGAGAVKVVVAKRDMDQAREIVEDFIKDSTPPAEDR